MSLKRLKRRLSWTLRGRQSSMEEQSSLSGLTDLTDQLTIEENGGIKENGKSTMFIVVNLIVVVARCGLFCG